jgi:His-Xaa-Ser repeat protein HxsA
LPSNPWKSLKALFGWTVPSIMSWVSVWAPPAQSDQLADQHGGEYLSAESFAITFPNTLNAHADNIYAAHCSHSSHSSHRSHSSHSSHASHYSSSGSYSRPSPTIPSPSPSVPNATPNPIAPVTPPDTSQTPKLNPDALADLVLRVQIALYLRDYDPGPLNRILGPQTRIALQAFQKDHGLPVTGTMDTKTLDALGITLP